MKSKNKTAVARAAERVLLFFVSRKNLTFIFEVATARSAAMEILSKNGLNRYITSTREKNTKKPKKILLSLSIEQSFVVFKFQLKRIVAFLTSYSSFGGTLYKSIG